MLNFIRTLIFYCSWFCITIVYATFSLITFIFPFKLRYQIITFYSLVIIKLVELVCGLHFEVRGMENLPQRPCVILSNHQSTWETLAFQKIFPLQTWVVKKQLLKIPFFGWAFALLNPIAIDRNKKNSAIDQLLLQGKQQLIEGRWLIVFPEGTRTAIGERKKFSSGGALLAKRTNTPVIPVAHNAGTFWQKHAFIIKPGKIIVTIGCVIDSDCYSTKEITNQSQTWVFQQLAEMNG